MRQEIPRPDNRPDPAELVGLTPEQQERAVELTRSVADRTDQLHRTQDTAYNSTHIGMLSGNTVSGPSVSSMMSGDIAIGFRKAQLKSAEFSAKRHYKKHEAEYQVQAFKDATEAGVDIKDWPQDRPKHSPKRRLGNLALASADVATTAAVATSLVTPVGVKDIIPAYLAYRFGKGAAVRGAAAVRGKGDPEMALSTKKQRRIPLSVHGSKKDLRARRERNKKIAERHNKLGPAAS
jgi:hypothetical protein